MDLTYTEEEQEFRARLRVWLAKVLPELPAAPSPDDWPGRRAYDLGWQRRLYEAGYAGLHWPLDAGGRGATPTQHLIFLEETERAGCTVRRRELRRAAARRSDHRRRGHGRAAGALAAARAARRRGVVPGIQRAGRRVGPGLPADAGRARRRRLRDHWVEDLDLARGGRRLVRAAGAHRSVGPQAPGDLLAGHADGRAGGDGAAAAHAQPARRSSRRCSSTRCGSRWPTGSVRRTTAGASPWSRCPSSGAPPSSARSSPAAGPWGNWPGRRRPTAGGTIRCCGAGWGGCTGSSARCGGSPSGTSARPSGRPHGVPGIGGSVFKLAYSHARQELYDTAAEVLGASSLSLEEGWVLDRLSSLSYTIAAGTSQIQQNIVAERILGLPKGR